jgi:hypothetical protein
MQEYLLKVSKGAAPDVKQWLVLDTAPSHVRLSTLAPLSNYGYAPGAEAALLKVSQHGVVTGTDGDDAAPHDFVPWQNVAYLSDGTGLFREMSAKK